MGDVHRAVTDAVVAGASLGHVAALAARELGSPVAIVMPATGVVVIEPADRLRAAHNRTVLP